VPELDPAPRRLSVEGERKQWSEHSGEPILLPDRLTKAHRRGDHKFVAHEECPLCLAPKGEF
jgi:hypothetical protein